MTSTELREALGGGDLRAEIEKLVDYCQDQADTAKEQARKYEKTGGPRARSKTAEEKRIRTATANYAEAKGEATAYRDVVATLRGLLRRKS